MHCASCRGSSGVAVAVTQLSQRCRHAAPARLLTLADLHKGRKGEIEGGQEFLAFFTSGMTQHALHSISA